MGDAEGNEEELRFAIQKLARRIRQSRSQELSDGHLTVLFYVGRHGPTPPSELAAWEHVTPPSMNRTINALERNGFVARGPDSTDARRVLVAITDPGRDLLQATQQLRAQWFRDRLDGLTPEERAVLDAAGPVLRKLADG